MHEVWPRLRGGVVISCQARAGEPLDGPQFIVELAKAAVLAGASGLRLDRAENILPVKATASLPIIGIRKRHVDASPVHITGPLVDAQEVLATGVAILGVDGTPRPRGDGASLGEIVGLAHAQQTQVLADIATEADAEYALSCGCDALATTLSGYTPETAGTPLPNLGLLETLARRYDVPVILEGGITRPSQVCQAFDAGAFAVVIGKAITMPHFIGRMYVDEAKRCSGSSFAR